LGLGFLAATTMPLGAQLSIDPRVLSTSPNPDQPTERQLAPVVGATPSGSLLVWEESRRGVVAEWFGVDGAPRGETRVLAASDPYPALPFRGKLREQREPAIAVRADGSFVLAWTESTANRQIDQFMDNREPLSSRVIARSYSADGSPQGQATEVGQGRKPSVALTRHGALVAWLAPPEAHNALRIRSWNGAASLGDAVTLGDEAKEAVTAAGKASTLVVWEGTSGGLGARLVDDAGAPLGTALDLGAADGAAPAAAWDGRGQFLVAWQSASSSPGVYARLLGASGKAAGPRFAVSPAEDEARTPAVTALSDGGWGAAWVSWHGPSRTAIKIADLDSKGRARGKPVLLSAAQPPTDDLAVTSGARGVVVAWPAYSSEGNLLLQARQSVRSR
jgi:hypothetical protein